MSRIVQKPNAEGKGRYPNLETKQNIYYPKLLQQKEYPESVCRTTMVRSLEYKYVKRTSGENELYDLINDPKECVNLYHKQGYKVVVDELEKKMLEWYMLTSDVVPIEEDPRGFGR